MTVNSQTADAAGSVVWMLIQVREAACCMQTPWTCHSHCDLPGPRQYVRIRAQVTECHVCMHGATFNTATLHAVHPSRSTASDTDVRVPRNVSHTPSLSAFRRVFLRDSTHTLYAAMPHHEEHNDNNGMQAQRGSNADSDSHLHVSTRACDDACMQATVFRACSF